MKREELIRQIERLLEGEALTPEEADILEGVHELLSTESACL